MGEIIIWSSDKFLSWFTHKEMNNFYGSFHFNRERQKTKNTEEKLSNSKVI